MTRYILAWFPMLALAIANGTLRQFVFLKAMPELRAHQLSTLTLGVLTGIYIWWVVHRWPPALGRQALLIGAIWVALTVGVEFFIGLVISKRPMEQLLADYNVGAGRVWPIYLIWLGVAAWVLR